MVAIVSKTDVEKPVHVFVLGVSRYRHFADGTDASETGTASGLAQLTSAARSASEFAAWVLKNVPQDRLASLYLNVAPSANEILEESVQELLQTQLGGPPSATREKVVEDWKAFYQRCKESRDATAYIYAAGHGIQSAKEGAILLLEDFGVPLEPKLWAALDLVAMNRTLRGAEFAALQFWFVDCCREPADAADYGVAELRQPYAGFDVPDGECIAAPILFATLPREQAWARTAGVSLFNEALIKALRKDAATRPQESGGNWCVTTSSLAKALNEHVSRESGNLQQQVYVAGHAGTTNEVLHVFAQPPPSRLTITLEPEQAHDVATADIDQDDTPIAKSLAAWPVQQDLPAGVYIVRINAEPRYSNATRAVVLDPPSFEQKVRLT